MRRHVTRPLIGDATKRKLRCVINLDVNFDFDSDSDAHSDIDSDAIPINKHRLTALHSMTSIAVPHDTKPNTVPPHALSHFARNERAKCHVGS